jgi:nucleoid-associated protein YgaU
MRALTVAVMAMMVAMAAVGCGPKKEDVPQMTADEIAGPPTVGPTTPAVVVETPARPTGTSSVERTSIIGRLPTTTPTRTTAVVPPLTAATTYTVVKGDTLSSIARKFYGDASAGSKNRILDANKAKIKDPNIVPVGAVLTIPAK